MNFFFSAHIHTHTLSVLLGDCVGVWKYDRDERRKKKAKTEVAWNSLLFYMQINGKIFQFSTRAIWTNRLLEEEFLIDYEDVYDNEVVI